MVPLLVFTQFLTSIIDIRLIEWFRADTVRRHVKWHRFQLGLRETLLTLLIDIKRQLCGIASVDVQ